MRPSNSLPAAVHVDLDLDPLADAQVGQLRFLEVGVDPDFGERADRHQALPGLHVVAGVDVAARDDAVDLGDDVAVAQIQLGLIQMLALASATCASACLICGGFLDELGVDAIEISLGIALVELVDHFLGRGVPRLRHNSQRRGACQQSGPALRERWRSLDPDLCGTSVRVSALPPAPPASRG